MTQENPDWRLEDSPVSAVIHAAGKKFILPLKDLDESSYLASSFHHFIDEKSLVLAWGIKDFFSFLKGRTGILPEIICNIYDLQIICSYFGYPKEKPTSFKDAVVLLKRATKESGWEDFKKFHNAVYRPLFSSVVPKMETFCLVHNKRRICVYPSYAIEGQANGRLKAVICGKDSYNPHSLGPDERQNIRPAGYDESFVYFDFKNMEVCVLAWLSGDKKLNAILNSDKDPYEEIWLMMSGSDASEQQRNLCKKIFLPVVFGLGKYSLAKKMNISEKVSGMIIDNLVKSFPESFRWVEEQSNLDNSVAFDCFGRKRTFNLDDSYKARNFSIQSPASMICLRKLVQLDSAISGFASLCFHVHDGYCVVCERSAVDEVCEIGINCLESDDNLFPDLKLRVTCESGSNLDDLQTKTRKVQLA